MKRLPVVIQMAWFRLVYPQGKIAVQVSSGKDCFVATARVYANYQDPVECYLAEATASRGVSTTKPVSFAQGMGADSSYWDCTEKCWVRITVCDCRRRSRKYSFGTSGGNTTGSYCSCGQAQLKRYLNRRLKILPKKSMRQFLPSCPMTTN